MKKRLLCLLLAAAAVFAVGCDGAEKPSIADVPEYSVVKPLEFDAWLGPKTSDAALRDYADCGYTTYHLQAGNFDVTNTRMTDGELNDQLDRIFTKSKEYGLKVVLATTAVNTSANSITPFEYTYSRVGKTLEKWKDDPTFYGFMPSDETTLDKPLVSSVGGLKFMQNAYDRSIDFLRDDYLFFSQKFPGKYFETTLLGIPNGQDKNMPYFTDSSRSFDEYMDCYYDDLIKYMPVSERVYSHDAYPFSRANGVYKYEDRFVGSLEGIAVRAEKAGAKKGMYTQNHHSIINPESVSYQYFTAMTYGYTHFTTYCYTDEWGEKQYSTTNAGVKTDNYYYFKSAHEKVKSMEAVYTNFCDSRVGTMGVTSETKGVKTWSKCTAMSESLPLIRSAKSDQDLLIGAFTDKSGNYGYMLANQMMPDDKTENTVRIDFKGVNKVAVWADGKPAETVDAKGGKFVITLASGGGAFIVPLA